MIAAPAAKRIIILIVKYIRYKHNNIVILTTIVQGLLMRLFVFCVFFVSEFGSHTTKAEDPNTTRIIAFNDKKKTTNLTFSRYIYIYIYDHCKILSLKMRVLIIKVQVYIFFQIPR